jgi:putative transposase
LLFAASKRALSFAIDYVLIPFYGEEENEGDTVRSKAKEGTTRFSAYASIYVILRNKRYTLAVKYCRKGEDLTDVIAILPNEVKEAGFKVRGLYLDKQFYTVPVINYLPGRGIPFIIPCVPRGRSGGIRKLFVGKTSYSTQYNNALQRERSHFSGEYRQERSHFSGEYRQERSHIYQIPFFFQTRHFSNQLVTSRI